MGNSYWLRRCGALLVYVIGLASLPAGAAEGTAARGANYQGSYAAALAGGTLGLTLEQSGGKVVGRLRGPKGVYEMSGELQPDGRVVGVARSAASTYYFGGQKAGAQLQLMIAEPAAGGGIKRDTAQTIVFVPAAAAALPTPQALAAPRPAAPALAAQATPQQCSQSSSACMTACSKVGGGIGGMNQCIAQRCTPDYQKCMAGRQPKTTAADRDWADQLSRQSGQIHQQQMQSYQNQIDSTAQFSRQQEERLNRERFGN